MTVFSSFLSSLAENSTGTVDKAYIVFIKPYNSMYDNALANAQDNNRELFVEAFNNSLKRKRKSVYEQATALTRNAGSADDFKGTVKTNFPDGEGGNYQYIKVQYNPSTVRISSSNGRRIRPNAVAGGNEMGLQESNLPFRTTMSMELFFDDTDNSDAFSSLDGGLWSQTGIAKNLSSSLYNKLKSGSTVRGHTVQDISELFIAAAVNPKYRMIVVVWNKMVFAGEIHSVDLDYLMFNSAGNPIRSKVRLEIMGSDRYTSAQHNEDWDAIYKKMFSASKTLASSETLTGSASGWSDLLNLK